MPLATHPPLKLLAFWVYQVPEKHPIRTLFNLPLPASPPVFSFGSVCFRFNDKGRFCLCLFFLYGFAPPGKLPEDIS